MMERLFAVKNKHRLRFVLGDVRDYDRVCISRRGEMR